MEINNGKEFNEKIWHCKDERQKFDKLLTNIVVMQELLKTPQLTDEDKSNMILALNIITKSLVADAISNENEANEIMQNNYGSNYPIFGDKEAIDATIEDVINNSNELNKIRTNLKNNAAKKIK